MSEIFFSSDHHFGHRNIMKYEPVARPFETLHEMHEVMIERWNHMVTKNDMVFYLGDFAFGHRNIMIAERLNGRKKLILGNHDKYPIESYTPYFEKIYGVLFWEKCILSHVPCHPGGVGDRWKLNVHGHLHSKNVQNQIYGWHEIKPADSPGCNPTNFLIRKPIENEFEDDMHYINVSVEQNNLIPIHVDVIRERLKIL